MDVFNQGSKSKRAPSPISMKMVLSNQMLSWMITDNIIMPNNENVKPKHNSFVPYDNMTSYD